MKVTIDQRENQAVTLKIEGRVYGPMVPELQRAWNELASTLNSRKLLVDLRGVTFLDDSGKRLLAEIHTKTRAEFVADTPLSKYFAEQAQEDIELQSMAQD